jgi:translation initiation factor IF-3
MFLFKTRKKEAEVDSDGPRLNEKITGDYVRLVSEEGNILFQVFFSFGVWKVLDCTK